MSTLAKNEAKSARAYVPLSALAETVEFDDIMMHVHLTDGRVISVPVLWFPILAGATPEQRADYEIGGGGTSLYWPQVDEDLSVVGLMAGGDKRSM